MSTQSLFSNWISDRIPGFFRGGLAWVIFWAAFMCFSSYSFGQATRTWQGSAGGDWNTPGNWSGGLVPVAGDNVIIDSDQSAPITGHPAISLLSLSVTGSVTLESDAGPGVSRLITVTGTFSVAGGKILTLGASGTGGTNFTLAAGATGTLDGTLILNSATASPASIIINGNLAISPTGLISGPASSSFTLSAGATLQIAHPGGITSTGGATGAILVGGTRTYSTGASYIYNGTGAQATGNGLVQNTPVNLTITNTAGVTLGGGKTISGALVVNPGSTFVIPDNRYLASGNITMLTGSAATSITGNGIGYLGISGNLTVSGTAGATISSLVDLGNSGPRNITVEDGAADADLTISGVIRNSARIVKSGAGTMVLSGANTYSGTTTISEGILRLGSNGALSPSSAILMSGGALSTGSSIGFNATAGEFRLIDHDATIALGTGSHSLQFASAGGWSPGRILTITGWAGSVGSTGTSGKIYFGSTLSPDHLQRVNFSGYPAGGMQLPTGELVPATYIAQVTSINLGSSTWCPGETRNVSVVIRNNGTATWKDGTDGAPTINIGVKWNPNGASWNDYYVKISVPPTNHPPGVSRTYTLSLTASEHTGAGYGGPLPDGSNNISVGLEYEGLGWFSSNTNGLGPGNTVFTSPAVTIASAPSGLTYSENTPIYCAGESINANIPSISGGSAPTSYSISPALPPGLTLNTTSGQITGTPTTLAGVSAADFTVTATNSCGNSTAVLNIAISPAKPASLSYSDSGPLTYCVDQAIPANNASTSGGGPATSYSVSPALPAGLSLNTSTGQISGTPTTVTSVADYVVTASNACGGTSRTLSISVSPAAPGILSYSDPDPIVYCALDPIEPNEATITGGGPATSFSVSPALPAGLTLNTDTGQITGTPTAIAGEAENVYTVTATNSCGFSTYALTITVAPAAPFNLSYTNNEPLTYCAGEAITANNASTDGGEVTSYSVSPSLPAGLTLNETTGQITGTPTAADGVDAANYTITAENHCGQTSRVLNITILPAAPAGLSYNEEGPLNYCANVEIKANGATTSGGGAPTNFSVSPALPAGLTINPTTGEITGTPTNLSGVPATNYVVTASNSCGNTTKTLNIAISPAKPTNLTYTDNGPLVYCVGEAITANNAAASGGGPATSYSISPALPAGLTLNTSTGQISGTPTTVAGVPATDYTVTATNSCGGTSRVLNITIAAQPTALAGPTLPIICQGGTSLPMGGSVGGGATGGIWSGGEGTWTNASDPAGATYTPSATESGAIILTLTTTGGSCGTIIRTKTITVNPTPVFTSATAITRCTDQLTTYTATSSLPGTTYSWTRATVPGISNPAGSGTGPSATENLINTTTDPIEVTYIYTLRANGCTTTENVVVTVNSATVILQDPDPDDHETCSGDKFADISVTATGTNLTYQWYRNTEPDTVSGMAIDGEVSSTFSPSYITLGSHYYYVKVSGTCGTLVSELSGKYDVFPSTTQIETQPSSGPQSVCKDEAFSPIEVLASGNVTYQWYRNTVNSNNGGTLLPGEINTTITPPSNVVGTFYYYAIATSAACGTARTNVSGAFTVRPKPEVSDMIAVVCSDGTFTANPVDGTNGVVPTGTTYTWSAPTVEPGISGGVAGTGNNIFGSLTNSTSVPLTATYTVTPLTGTCPGDDFTVTVTVNPTPVLSSTLTPPAICSNTAFTYSPLSETIGATYTWTRATVPGISNAAVTTPQGTNPNETLINTTANPVEVIYTYSIIANGCSNTQNVIVTVNPTPTLSSTLTPPAICTNTLFTYTPESQTGDATYTWTRASVDGISNAAVTTPQETNPNETLINTTANPIDVVYAYTITANGCSNTQNVTVRVNPTPTLSSTLTPLAICTNTAFTYTPTSNTGGTSFSWTRAVVAGISNAAGGGTGPVNETLINTTALPVNVVYKYTLTANGCSNSQEVTVSVNPTLTLSSTLTPPAICSNTAFTYTPASQSVNVEYRWTRAAVSGISNPAVTTPQATNPNETLINTTAAPVNVVYTYTLTANGCSNTQNVTVTVNPTPIISDMTVTICSGDTFNVIPANGGNGLVPAGTTYTWEVANNPNNIAEDTNQRTPQNSISQTLTNTTTAVQTVIYTVFPVSGGCVGAPFTLTVTVNPVPTVTTPNQGVCNGGLTEPINFTGNNIPGKTYTWTNDNPSIGLPASGTGNIPAFNVINTGATNKIANITVTPYANGCPGPQHTFTITASATPTITLGADYCAEPGFVQLQAGSNIPGTTYTWNTSPVQTGPIANVDLAGTFIVTATTPDGCQKTASISVAQELVVNGSFTDGNVGFFSGNTYVPDHPDPLVNNELEPEGTYTVGTNAHDYHRYFWGIDHTNNTVGDRNMLIINTSDPTITVWQQTVNVEANTQYYFSAWAMSINPAEQYPRPKLRFEVRGVQVGSIAALGPGPGTENQANNNTYWERFYGIWSSYEYSGPITIRIVNLEPSLSGNDFALDDISFGTLSTFLILTSPVGTDDQVVCENSPITDISYSAGSGLEGPEVDDLPDGLDYTWNGVTLRIFGTPTESGTFEYTVRTTGACDEVTKKGTITVQASPEAGEISGNQTICSGDDPAPFTSTAPGSSPGASISYRWESSVSPFEDWTTIDGATGATYDVGPGLSTTTRYRRITLASLSGLICESMTETSPTVTVTVQSPPTPGVIAGEQAICEGGDPVALTSPEAGTGDGAISYLWESSVSPFTSWSPISGAESATYDVPAGLSVTTQYRRTTISDVDGKLCNSDPTAPVQVTVQSVPTPGEIEGSQTICSGDGPTTILSAIAGTGTGTIIYRWESNTHLDTPNWIEVPFETSPSYVVPSGLTVTTQYRRFAISDVSGQQCESSSPTSTVTITVQSVPTAGEIAGIQTVCSGEIPATINSTTDGTGDGTISYRWESSVSPFDTWTVIADATASTYNATSGLTSTTLFRRMTVSTLDGASCLSEPTASVEVTISPDNEVTAAPSQTLCVATPLSPITHTTTGATGIVPESASVRYNLPNGVTATWAAGTITISGTPTESGVFNYNIPLIGGCGSVSAVGTITVTDPSYPISRIEVVNPQIGDPTPATSTFTVYSAELTPGTYTVVYSTSGVNQGPVRTITVNVTTAGQFTFTSLPYTLGGTTLLTILSIQKSTDLCAYVPPYQNTALYGIGCSEAFLRADGNDAFYVPANVYEVTIQVFGNGMGGSTVSRTMPVWPSGVIYVVFDGSNVFATEVPSTEPVAVRLANSIVSTSGPNGRIVFSYDCNPLQDCATTVDNGNQYTSSNGFTVVRFDLTGDCVWQAPDGLTEFEVLVVGGGGGGGFGSAAGGGGGGAVVYQQYMDITMGGEPGLQGATFNISVGGPGVAALTPVQAGGTGDNSSFSGPAFTYLGGTFSPLSAAGGGGGGSTSATAAIRQGGNGASGGGGAASGSDESAGGVGIIAGTSGGGGYGETTRAGGGGGGGAAGAGTAANVSAGTMNGGSGGSGRQYDISGEDVYYGAGGGGTSSGAVINQAGAGGSPYNSNGIDYVAGGGGTNNGLGQPATTYGSGGGAGSTGGSPGFPGVIYIRYPNYSILPVEYLHFDAKYNPTSRSGDLTWTTAKEWENERFDVERSVNTVKDWETIGQVKGAGYSDQPLDYAFQDFNLPLSGGNIFYRLKQRSFNGDSSYSDTKAIRVEPMRGTSYWRIYPNPTTGDPINLELMNSGIYHDEIVTVRIIASTGQYDVVESVAGSSLNALVSDKLRTKAAGVYTVEINWGIYREYHKVILRR
jgi:autotransporter-associated beta strand protein